MNEQPTYTTTEALQMMRDLQHDEVGLVSLGNLITEERHRYTLHDLELLKFYFDILMLRFIDLKYYGFFNRD